MSDDQSKSAYLDLVRPIMSTAFSGNTPNPVPVQHTGGVVMIRCPDCGEYSESGYHVCIKSPDTGYATSLKARITTPDIDRLFQKLDRIIDLLEQMSKQND